MNDHGESLHASSTGGVAAVGGDRSELVPLASGER